MNSRGKLGEIEAAKFLRKKRYKILDVNYTTRFGEIDIIASNKKYICFIEVKQRSNDSIAQPKEFVNHAKQKKIIASSQIYLMNNKTNLQPRFDVIEIITENNKTKLVKHLENAFQLV
ncbi:MAG: YraN family protein [Eubacterium sp.]|nr:YraN family protein [Eubacterium sp.]